MYDNANRSRVDGASSEFLGLPTACPYDRNISSKVPSSVTDTVAWLRPRAWPNSWLAILIMSLSVSCVEFVGSYAARVVVVGAWNIPELEIPTLVRPNPADWDPKDSMNWT